MCGMIISCTKHSKDEFWNDTPLGKTLHALPSLVNFDIMFENSRGLPEVYNESLDAYAEDDLDWMLFVHDDVELTDTLLCEKLDDAFKKYDVIGLAGTASYAVKSPAVWNNSPRDRWSGMVVHEHQGEYWSTSFGKVPQRCIIVDGLFIAINAASIGDVRFDERFKFHHYDMDFCLSAHGAGLKIGTAPILVTHHSVGDWTTDPSWRDSEQKFLAKWGQPK